MKWTPAKVGCWWYSGEFTIGTRVSFENGEMVYTYPKSGYVLTRDREELGIYPTLRGAQEAASKVPARWVAAR